MGAQDKVSVADALWGTVLGALRDAEATQKEGNTLRYRLKRLAVRERLVRATKAPASMYAFHVTRTRSGGFKWTARFTSRAGRPVYFHGLAGSFGDCLAAFFHSLETKEPHPDKLRRS